MDCRDIEDVSVLLLLSGAIAVGTVAACEAFLSPVKRSLLKSSTS